jgi:hypothetical protein
VSTLSNGIGHVKFQRVPRFRLFAFWIDELELYFNADDVTDTLKRLPMVTKHSTGNTFYAHKPSWLLFSVRPLKLGEIAAAACFSFSGGRPAFNENPRFANPKAVLDVCRGLVVMSEGTTFCMI